MSNKERIIELLDVIPDYKMGYVLAYVQGVAADEEADDIFCQRMVKNYENSSSKRRPKNLLTNYPKRKKYVWFLQ